MERKHLISLSFLLICLGAMVVAVNRTANCVTVYSADEDGLYTVPYLAMVCSTGGEKTSLGVWKNLTQEESPVCVCMISGT